MADFSINPLVAQYLSGLGADLMKYGGNTNEGLQLTKTNEVTNQNIKSNNMMKLMQQALGPDGSSVKVDNKGVKIDVTPDSEMYKMLMGGSGISTPAQSDLVPQTNSTKDTRPTAPASTTTATPAASSTVVNPFNITPPTISNNLSGIDPGMLAGLTPQEITSVMDMKSRQDQLKQQSYRDIVDSLYKGQVDVPYKKALTAQAEAATAENTASVPITVGGKSMTVTPKDAIAWAKMEKETTPNEIKLYEYAQKQGFSGSIVDFKNADQTGHQKDYQAAVKGGYKGDFNGWLLDQAKAGAINLGTKVEEKKAMSELAGQLYFNDPKWTEDINKQTADFDKNQAWLVPEKDRPLAKSKVIVKTIEDKISAGSGAIQNVTMDKDGKTMVWTVKWPSGDVKTIKHAVK